MTVRQAVVAMGGQSIILQVKSGSWPDLILLAKSVKHWYDPSASRRFHE
jgi:hypothetical protein